MAKKKLKLKKILPKIFLVMSHLIIWYEMSAMDKVITTDECAELGFQICDILGVKVNINLD